MSSSVISNSAYGIIEDAMRAAGLLGDGDTPDSETLAVNLRRLNDLVNAWQTQGLKLWLQTDLAIPLVANQNQYVLSPNAGSAVVMTKPLRALQGYILLASSNVRRPIYGISWSDWMLLPQTIGNTGAISQFFVDKQAAQLNINFWLTPDATEAANTAHLLIEQQVNNAVNLESSTQFPQEWRIALVWGLADEICTGQPDSVIQRCMMKAQNYRTMLENWDVEDVPTRFAVSTRYTSQRRRMR